MGLFDFFSKPVETVDELISKQSLRRVDFGIGYEDDNPQHGRVPVTNIAEANVVSSDLPETPGRHRVLLDIDVPAFLVPSSTKGHSHLYVDTVCSWTDYVEFLQAAAKIGLVEPGYVSVSELRGYTSLRLPGVPK